MPGVVVLCKRYQGGERLLGIRYGGFGEGEVGDVVGKS